MIKKLVIACLLVSFVGCLSKPVYVPPEDPYEENTLLYQNVYQAIYPAMEEFARTGVPPNPEQLKAMAGGRKGLRQLVKQNHLPAGYLSGASQVYIYEGYKNSGGINGKYKTFWESIIKKLKLSPSQYEKRLVKDRKEGIEMLHLIARTGYQPAINQLRRLKIPIPVQDFKPKAEYAAELSYLDAQINYNKEQQALTSAIVAGLKGINSQNQSNTNNLQSDGCSFDTDCGIGQKCFKGSFQATGICGKLTDSYGLPSYDLNAQPKICSFDTDCAIGFKCRKTSGLSGFCVK